VLNSLLDQFSRLGVVSDVLSKNANVVQGIPSVSGWYQFPDVRFQYKEHASLIDQEVQTTRWGTLVVVVADFDFVEEYANILQLVAHLKVESVFFYAATQLFNGVNTSCLFRHFEAESIIISFREMSLRT